LEKYVSTTDGTSFKQILRNYIIFRSELNFVKNYTIILNAFFFEKKLFMCFFLFNFYVHYQMIQKCLRITKYNLFKKYS